MWEKVKKVCFLKLLDDRLLMKHDLLSWTSLRGHGTLRISSQNRAWTIRLTVRRDKHDSHEEQTFFWLT